MTTDRADIASRIAASQLQPTRQSNAVRSQRREPEESFSEVLAEQLEEAERLHQTAHRSAQAVRTTGLNSTAEVRSAVQQAEEAFQKATRLREQLQRIAGMVRGAGAYR
ncbi:MAG: hypothetical protein KatS3mg115_1560 [Candidatus Poribacteria bacterium]|nr:MAG: hypothetical protein KatS3mg115_1560 [Candidatus Poribacteria bacterium]